MDSLPQKNVCNEPTYRELFYAHSRHVRNFLCYKGAATNEAGLTNLVLAQVDYGLASGHRYFARRSLEDEKAELSKPAKPVRKRPRIQSNTPLQALPSPPAEKSKLELYNADGRLRVPADMLDQIDRKYGDKRVFSYQVPRLDDAKKEFYRNPAIIYEKTRFDEYWKPDQDLLTGLLSEMVEKTTKQIKIPVPGRPDSKMVCTISLLALGGGCGVLTNGSDYVGPVDDPDTLSPEEDKQCKAWWDQIVGASTQDAWRKTRKLYEEQCRKPLERVPAG